MKAVIPVAGIGTRLKPLTNTVPKVLVNVGGKPMLFHLIDEIINSKKIESVILVIGYLGERIKHTVDRYYGSSAVKFLYTEQNEMLGLGHAILQSEEYVGDDPVLIVLGDTVFEFNLNLVLDSEFSLLGVKEVEDTSRFGIIETDSEGYIKRLIEKPEAGVTKSKSAIAGIYYIKETIAMFSSIRYLIEHDIRTKGEYQITDAFMKMVNDGVKLLPFEIENWFDCGKPETLLSTNAYLLKRDYNMIQQYPFDNLTVEPPVFIPEGCFIENAHIGPNVTLSRGVKIINSRLADTVVLENSVIENAELEETVIGENQKITGIHSRVIFADGIISAF
jgi:glucose-1-phosphate thymidylyltransferase